MRPGPRRAALPGRRRLAQTLAFVALAAALAGGFGEAGARAAGALHPLPALALAVAGGAGLPLLLALLPPAASLLAGRLYCGWLCPAGFIQDLAAALARRFRRPLSPPHPRPRLRTALLAACLALAASGGAAWGFLDHFTHFGRLLHEVLLPLAFIPVQALMPVGSEGHALPHFAAGVPLAAALGFLALLLVALRRPRWFCATLCPTGTLFTLLGRVSLFRVERAPACPGCGRCDRLCPARCMEGGGLDADLCIACFECLEFCPAGSVRFARRAAPPPASPASPVVADPARRRLLSEGAALLLGGAAGAVLARAPGGAAARVPPHLILPPGAGLPGRFHARCVGCGVCAAACPSGVIEHAGFEAGLRGLLSARMNFDRSYCYFDCARCATVCPTGALERLTLEEKKLRRLGVAAIDEKTCIPYEKKKDCAACAEHCPTGAIEMVEREGIRAPKVRAEFCIGCGACQYICPVRPLQAIVVTRPEGMVPVAEKKPPAPPKLPPAPKDGGLFPF